MPITSIFRRRFAGNLKNAAFVSKRAALCLDHFQAFPGNRQQRAFKQPADAVTNRLAPVPVAALIIFLFASIAAGTDRWLNRKMVGMFGRQSYAIGGAAITQDSRQLRYRQF